MDTTNNSEASGAAQNITMSKKVLVVVGDLNWSYMYMYAYFSKMMRVGPVTVILLILYSCSR